MSNRRKTLNPIHKVSYKQKVAVVDAIVKQIDSLQHCRMECDAANENVYLYDPKTNTRYFMVFSVKLRCNSIFRDIAAAYRTRFIEELVDFGVEEQLVFNQFQCELQNQYRNVDLYKVDYERINVMPIVVNPDESTLKSLNSFICIVFHDLHTGDYTIKKYERYYDDVLNPRSSIDMPSALFHLHKAVMFHIHYLTDGDVPFMSHSVFNKIVCDPKTPHYAVPVILNKYSSKFEKQFTRRSFAYMKEQGLDAKNLYSPFRAALRKHYAKWYYFTAYSNKQNRTGMFSGMTHNTEHAVALVSFFLNSLYQFKRNEFYRIVEKGINDALQREILFWSVYPQIYISDIIKTDISDNKDFFEMLYDVYIEKRPSMLSFDNPRAFFKRINSRSRLWRYLTALANMFSASLSLRTITNSHHITKTFDYLKFLAENNVFIKRFKIMHDQFSDLIIENTQPGDDYKIEYLLYVASLGEFDINKINIANVKHTVWVRTPEKGFRASAKLYRKRHPSQRYLRQVGLTPNMYEYISDALSMFEDWQSDNALERYGLAGEAASVMKAYYNNNFRSIKSLFVWSKKVHDLELTINKRRRKSKLKNYPMYPLPDVLEDLYPFWLSNTYAMMDAGIELRHCIGSYASYYNEPQWFFRKDTVAAQVAWISSTNRLELSQCYDICNSITENSKAFAKEIAKIVSAANRQLKSDPSFTGFVVIDKASIEPLSDEIVYQPKKVQALSA